MKRFFDLGRGFAIVDSLDFSFTSPPESPATDFRHAEDAREFLERFKGREGMKALRSLLTGEMGGLPVSLMEDGEVIHHVSRILVARRYLVQKKPVFYGGSLLAQAGEAVEEEKAAPQPARRAQADEEITVQIRAENGKDAPPEVMGVKTTKQLKGVPSKGSGTYRWSTTSSYITLTNTSSQTVTVKAGDKHGSSGGEEIKLLFTPAGKAALPEEAHSINVGTVAFSREDSHLWGYDAYETIDGKDKDRNPTSEKPPPDKDFISIRWGKIGKVKINLYNLTPDQVFFKCKNGGHCEPDMPTWRKKPGVLEIQTKGKKVGEDDIEAHLGSETGPLEAIIGVVVLKAANYEAHLFKVQDQRKKAKEGTKLHTEITVADTQKLLNKAYKRGVVTWKLHGRNIKKNVAYDKNLNGFLDLEPGITAAEEDAIMKACQTKVTRVIQVHDLRWVFYLAADAKIGDNEIELKAYGDYFDYIGLETYSIKDDKGRSKDVSIIKVTKATHKLQLSAPIGKNFPKVADKAALIWPLGGLSSDGIKPAWVTDSSSPEVLKKVIAHELGHHPCGFRDVCEIENVMHGVANANLGLRHRPIKMFYYPTTTEEQWKKIKR